MMATDFSQNTAAIEGIGPKYAELLGLNGVKTLRDLLSLQPDWLHGQEPALPLGSLEGWRAAAWLLTLGDVTPDLAECFVAAGILSVRGLADAGLQTLERAVQEAVDKKQIADPPSLYNLAALQRSAAKAAGDTVIVGFLHDYQDGHVIEGAVIRAGRDSTPVGPDGSFLITGVEAGTSVLSIEADGYPNLRFRVATKSGRVTGPLKFRLTKLPEAPEPKPLSEHSGAQLQTHGDSRIRRKTIGLDELPDDTWLRYHKDYADGQVKLLHVHRTRVGRDVFVERVKLARKDVPDGANVGTMLHWKDQALHASDKTMKEVALDHIRKFRPPFQIKQTRTLVPATRLERI